jgi:hypothetical protein
MKINHIRGGQGSGKTTKLKAIFDACKKGDALFLSGESTTAGVLQALKQPYSTKQRRYKVVCIDEFNPKNINLNEIGNHPAAQGATFHVAYTAGAA